VKVFAGTVDDPFYIDLGAASIRSISAQQRAVEFFRPQPMRTSYEYGSRLRFRF